MWVLVLCLALGEPGHHLEYGAPEVGEYATEEACDAARWAWWRSEAVPDGYGAGWHQFMPGSCDRVEPAPSIG